MEEENQSAFDTEFVKKHKRAIFKIVIVLMFAYGMFEAYHLGKNNGAYEICVVRQHLKYIINENTGLADCVNEFEYDRRNNFMDSGQFIPINDDYTTTTLGDR